MNNEGIYNTSEKSARYTEMKPSEEEKALYTKWKEIYKKLIIDLVQTDKRYEKLSKKQIDTLSNENARYLISLFTPYVSIEYTASLQQLNYINYFAKLFVQQNENTDNPFIRECVKVLREFSSALPKKFSIEGLNPAAKSREFSLLGTREHLEEFGETYSINYEASFASLAQSHRHRINDYEIMFLDTPKYYIPMIIRGTLYEDEWLKDISSLSHLYPQGMLIKVNEQGNIKKLIAKCKERLCGRAQLETAMITKESLTRYLEAVKDIPVLYNELLPYSHGPKCTFHDFKCNEPCVFGAKYGLDRII